MTPTLRVYEDPDAREAAAEELAEWLRLQKQGSVTEAEAVEMAKQAILETVRTDLVP